MKKQLSYIQNLRSDILNSKEEAINKFDEIISQLEINEKLDSVELITRYRDNNTNEIISLMAILAYDKENNKIDKTIINQIQNNNSNEILINEINQLKEEVNNLKELVNNNNNTEEEKDEFGSGYDIDNDYWIHCEYNITNISDRTQLFNSSRMTRRTSCTYYNANLNPEEYVENKIFKIKIDGVEQDKIIYLYKFDTLGKHTVDVLLKDTTKLPRIFFYNVTNLTKIIIPFSIKNIGSYSLSKLDNIELIQFNSKELPTIEYNTFYQTIKTNGIVRMFSNNNINDILGEKEKCVYDNMEPDTSYEYNYQKLPITWNVDYIDYDNSNETIIKEVIIYNNLNDNIEQVIKNNNEIICENLKPNESIIITNFDEDMSHSIFIFINTLGDYKAILDEEGNICKDCNLTIKINGKNINPYSYPINCEISDNNTKYLFKPKYKNDFSGQINLESLNINFVLY